MECNVFVYLVFIFRSSPGSPIDFGDKDRYCVVYSMTIHTDHGRVTMKHRFLFLTFIVVCCYPLFTGSAQKKGHGTIEPYSISLQALQGPSAVDLYVNLHTDDPVAFPIPTSLKKLQVKVFGDNGKLLLVRNSREVPVIDGIATWTLEDHLTALNVEVLALVKTDRTIDTEVLRASAAVLMRPDLIFSSVNALSEVNLNTTFSIEAVVRETNHQVGATATVSLYEGDSLLGSVPNVQVAPGGQVSVVFQGLPASTVGVHVYTLRISDADPAEYDVTNNEATISVTVLNPLTSYSLSYNAFYQRIDNRIDHNTRTATACTPGFDYNEESRAESFHFTGDANPPGPLQAPFDRIALTISSDAGQTHTLELTDLIPEDHSESPDGTFDDFYTVFDASSLHQVNLSTGRFLMDGEFINYAFVEINRFSSQRVFTFHFSNGTVDSGSHHDADSLFLNALNQITVSLLIEDDGFVTGGTALIDVSPPTHVAGSFTFNFFEFCGGLISPFTIVNSWEYDETLGFGSGTMSPDLPPPGKGPAELNKLAGLPDEISLGQNYPNPFNPSTTIQFQLPDDRRVNISVYNTLGQLIETVADEVMTAGHHTRQWNAHSVPSGLYFIRMEAGEYSATQRALLVK